MKLNCCIKLAFLGSLNNFSCEFEDKFPNSDSSYSSVKLVRVAFFFQYQYKLKV